MICPAGIFEAYVRLLWASLGGFFGWEALVMIDRLLYWVVGRKTRWEDMEQGEGMPAGDELGIGGGWEKI
ncbi:uncharacterized protein N7469_011059 [Penicillium citrinum]|uniref:Uncharacterized protein n=1 Tax=Penicillium citrinum TaxID=5077 RepID=A0A9W9NLI3_PENCI|nr:uncharacterized protein N7469_011059 [Penicillium citrinum]KAJ5222172.1 hypothetical protein N7469_011059 [Penicillium citrinum]